MSGHTPGPWNIYFNSQDDMVIRKMLPDGQESHSIARCHSGAANARLIASAPDLLEALRPIAKYGEISAEIIDVARAAIAKATGK